MDERRAWGAGMFDVFAERYLREMDPRFAPIVEGVVNCAELEMGQSVLDIGTGTGSVAIQAARFVGPEGDVTGIDVSDKMLQLADGRLVDEVNIVFRRGSAQEIPAVDNAFDVVLSSLVMMFVPDRAAAAREVARVLKPGGRFVAAVWAGPDECDIVKFQAIAASFTGSEPIPGVGPDALNDPLPFQAQLLDVGIDTEVETGECVFEFETFDVAWDIAAITLGDELSPERLEEAKRAIQDAMWSNGEGPRTFRNAVRYIMGRKG